ncbi:MAG: NAD(P)-dependent dehydrogenase (short-subunit alcohol dehydrogenase family) [Thermoproteota archaeon]
MVGGNSGIGLELAKQYKSAGNEVMVLCRKPSNELESLGVEIVPNIDVKDDAIIDTLSEQISWSQIDVLIHNAGILVGDKYPEVDMQAMRESFEVNTLGPLKTVLALRSKLSKGSKVGIVSSRVGSIEDNSSSNNYAYRTSKTAVNMVGKCLSLDLKEDEVSLALLHPGYVRTAMTSGNGLIDADESAAGLIKRMDELTLETTGIFVHSSGEVLTW